MKLKLILPLVCFLFFLPAVTHAQDQEFIENFSQEVTIRSDASIGVKETIRYDFGTTERHGIFRDIPVKYKARGGNYNLRISNISVTNEVGTAYEYQLINSGKNKQIKIGNANTVVSGPRTYVVSYTIGRVINYFGDYDELYWNVTGNGWQVPIDNAMSTVVLPKETSVSDIKLQCFAGPVGSIESCTDTSYSAGVGNTVGNVSFSQQNINLGEGFTIVVGFPKGIVHEPTKTERIREIIKDNGVLSLPLFTFFIFWFIWYKKGRDPLSHKTVVAQYDVPDNLTPAEVGTIVDEKADNKDLSAEIIHLAVKGYVSITKTESKGILFTSEDYRLDLLQPAKQLSDEFERYLLESLFGGKESVVLSSLKDTFYIVLEKIRQFVYRSVVLKGYFKHNPRNVQALYMVGGMVVLGLGFFVGVSTSQFYSGISIALSGLIIAGFSGAMPVKTVKGAETRLHILGLKLYLSVAEKERLKFFNAPEKNPKIFEQLLPYAMVLGVEKQWAKQFEGIYKQPPSWYHGSGGSAFNTLLFISALNNFSSTANSTLVSQPSSSASGGSSGFSGGSSGGGFGGGGGGSW